MAHRRHRLHRHRRAWVGSTTRTSGPTPSACRTSRPGPRARSRAPTSCTTGTSASRRSPTKNSGVILPPLSQLFLGIQLAGPDLTPETYRDGLFKAPASGGGPTTPLVSYGPDSGFKMIGENCELDAPRPDYYAIDDTVEIWWDAEATGPDESGKDGKGLWRYANDATALRPGPDAHG